MSMGVREEIVKGVKAPAASVKDGGSPACGCKGTHSDECCSRKTCGEGERVERGGVKPRRRGHACEASPCTEWPAEPDAESGATARSQFARTFADVLSGRFGGSWSVEWKGANRPAPSANRNRRTLSREK
jgi:hypothetical protein